MLITVYIATRNRIGLLARAIESVRGQTWSDLELIVVDDASSDDTPRLLAGVAAQDSRLRVITNPQPHGGAGARNAAILACRGDFVTGLDDDDTFTPDRLQRFADAWLRHERSGVRPAGLYSQIGVLANGTIVARSRKPATASYEDMFRENVVGNQIFAPRRHYLDAGLFNAGLPAWQDLEFFMRMLRLAGPARLDDAVTYHWDDSPRGDRISLKNEERMRATFDTVAGLHASGDPRRTQQLYLQLLSGYYGVYPTLLDWRRFAALGPWPAGMLRLLRAIARRTVRRWTANGRPLRAAPPAASRADN